MVTAQCRKRPESELQARAEMARRLDELERGDAAALQGAVRQAQGGLGERADKRRTYRFQEDRVVDHLTGRSAPCSRVLLGHLDALWA